MSSWDHGEVLQLKTHGNEYARKVWLGNAPPVGEGGRPKEGDDINVFKRFVVEAYENKRYYVEPVEGESYEASAGSNSSGGGRPTSGVRSAGRTITSHKPNVALQQSAFNTAPAAPLRPPQPVAAPAPQPVAAPAVDLLDFGAFDSAPAQTAPVSNNPVAAPANDVFDPFNTNLPVSAPPATAPVAQMQPMGATNQPNTGFGDAPFDPFGAMSNTQPAQTATQSNVPVMNNNFGMNNNVMNGMGAMNNNMMNGGMNSMMNGNHMSNGMGMQNNMMQQNMMNGGMMNNQMNMMQNNMMMNGMGNQMNNSMNMMQNQMNNSMNMMNGQMNTMHHQMGTPNSGMHKTMSSAPQPAMNMNIMQPMNNSISNNFGSKPAGDSGKKDPFAGLGF